MRRYIGLCLFLHDIHKASGEPFFAHIKTLAPECEYDEVVCPVTGEVFPAGTWRENSQDVSAIDWEYQAVLYERHGNTFPPSGGYRLWEGDEEVWYVVVQKSAVRRKANQSFEDAGLLLMNRRNRFRQEARRRELEANGIDATIRRQIMQSQQTGKRPVCGYF
jgi:hypothetical protein